MTKKMISDHILGLQEDKRTYSASRKPIIVNYEEDKYALDPDLRKLKYTMIRPTPDNREYAFWNDSISQSFSYITSATIIGDGLRIRSTNQEAENLIKDWNTQINVNRKSIEDYITHSWIDEIVHAGSYWRVLRGPQYYGNVDIQRLDPKTLVRRKDPNYGWLKYIQRVPNYKSYRSKVSFYRNASKEEEVQVTYNQRTKEIHIPDEPEVLLRTNFFLKPPISSALHYITYKRWIAYFMRKYSQKHWAPFIVALVGDPKTNFYPGEHEMQEEIDKVSEVIPKITNFGGVALPGDVSIKTLDSGSAKSAQIYVQYMEAMDKQIMMSIFASMGIREASGVEKTTQATLLESFLQFLKGMRRKYEISLKRFYAKCLCAENNINVSIHDIDIDWSPLRIENSLDLMKSIQIGVQTGMFADRNEVRKAGQTIYNWLEKLEGGDGDKIDFQLAQTRGVSVRTDGSAPGKSTKTKNPSLRV